MKENELTRIILNAAFEVHSNLGPGLLESSYQKCLEKEIRSRGLFVESEKALPLIYKEVYLEAGYRIDLLIERKIVIEIKAVEAINDVHVAQVLTYLKLSGCKLGLLLNFNTASLKSGIKRLINGNLN